MGGGIGGGFDSTNSYCPAVGTIEQQVSAKLKSPTYTCISLPPTHTHTHTDTHTQDLHRYM